MSSDSTPSPRDATQGRRDASQAPPTHAAESARPDAAQVAPADTAQAAPTDRMDAPSADETLLDHALLALLDRDPDAHADVFAERATKLVLGARAGRDREDVHPASWRRDEGVAARIVLPGATRGLHVSGPCDERALLLARAVAAGARAPDPPEAAPMLPFGEAQGGAHDDARERALHALLAELREASEAEVAREPRLRFVDVTVSETRRGVHVASSEWGHARQAASRRAAWIVAEAEDASGRRRRAMRGLGAATLSIVPIEYYKALVSQAARAALLRLEARPIPPGRPIVLVAPGAGGVLVHEAVGHSLEGDVVARGSSFLSGRIGERVASESLTVVDDPLLPALAGSHRQDDEGAPGTRAVLIERGVLRGILTDGVRTGFRQDLATGHGRRQGFRDQPLPRMTNTLLLPGAHDPADLLASTEDGILVTRLERASADPVRGRFQVRVTEGWRIEGGRLTHPLEEGLLVGASDRFLHGIEVGGDLAWDDGCGTCGREGQWVPVAVGQPTLRCAAGIFDVP
jgi:TldD protein